MVCIVGGMITIKAKNYSDQWENITFGSMTFNGGEEHIKLDAFWRFRKEIVITAKLRSSKEIIQLAMITDALRNQGAKNIFLNLPYVPYGRQDRVCNWGEAFSLRVFCDLLNSLNFDRVTIVDPHSDVTPALIRNCEVVKMLTIVDKFLAPMPMTPDTKLCPTETLPVSPDAGANKKVFEISQYCQKPMIRADKLRDVSNGEIKETIVFADNLNGQAVTIYDDICDGGRTFIELAKVLKAKGAKTVVLFVTHGIFSKGVQCLFDAGIDHIYTTDSLALPTTFHNDKVTILKLEYIL